MGGHSFDSRSSSTCRLPDERASRALLDAGFYLSRNCSRCSFRWQHECRLVPENMRQKVRATRYRFARRTLLFGRTRRCDAGTRGGTTRTYLTSTSLSSDSLPQARQIISRRSDFPQGAWTTDSTSLPGKSVKAPVIEARSTEQIALPLSVE